MVRTFVKYECDEGREKKNQTQINDRFAEMNTALTKFMEAARETNEQKYKIRAAEKEKENKRKLMELRQKQEQFAAENRQISDRRRQEYVKDGEGRRFIGMRRRNRRRIDENVTVRDERWMLVVSGNTI